MVSAVNGSLPPLPDGFTLDGAQGVPPLPPGFTMDAPQPQGEPAAAPAPQTSQTLGLEAGLSHVGQNVFNGLGYALRKAGIDVPMVQDTPQGKQEAAAFDPAQNGGVQPGSTGKFIGEQIGASPSFLLGPLAGGALNGALTTNADTPEGVAKDAAIGAVAGKAGQLAVKGAARVVAPQISPAVQKLRDLGIPLSVGQTLGGWAKTAEDAAQSIPVVGDMISAARGRSIAGLNRALGNEALAPIGKTLPADIPAGRQMIQHVADTIGSEYDRIVAQGQGVADQQLGSELVAVVNNAKQNLPAPQFDRFKQIVQNQLVGKIGSTPNFSGQTYKDITSELSRLSAGYKGDASVDNRYLGNAVSDLNNAMKSMFTRANPTLAPDLSNADQAWSNYAKLRDAASRAGSTDGVITPTTLQQAVRSGDRSVGKGNFAKGQAQLQDISDAAKSVIPSSVPDSGTPRRLMLDGLAVGGGYMLHPGIPLGLGAGAAAYTAPAQKALTTAIAGAPQTRQAIANWLVRVGNPVAAGSLLRRNASIFASPIPGAKTSE